MNITHRVCSGNQTHFWGGHDTISLHHTSLQQETIKVLMLAKKKLHLVCAQSAAASHGSS